MIYFVLVTIGVTAFGLITYTLLFDRRYFFGLLVLLVLCTGFLSYYVFYYIGSYESTEDDMILNVNLESAEDGNYKLIIDNKWTRKPEIFGFDGSDDILAIRYRPDRYEILDSDTEYGQSLTGKTAIKLSSKYSYSKISKSEREIYFPIKDGHDMSITTTIKVLKPGGRMKVFYIHDYNLPLDSPVYWEKVEPVVNSGTVHNIYT